MNKEAEKRIATKLAKTMAILCVRNTHLETIHTGKTPVTRTGDWSDVTVVDADADGRKTIDLLKHIDRLRPHPGSRDQQCRRSTDITVEQITVRPNT